MTDIYQKVQAAIDNKIQTVLLGTDIVFGNISDHNISQQEDPFVSVKTLYNRSNQFELGNTSRSREFGSQIFTLHTKINTGDGARNLLLGQIIPEFRSTTLPYVGGSVTFSNCRILPQANVNNWTLTVIQIPFWFTVI